MRICSMLDFTKIIQTRLMAIWSSKVLTLSTIVYIRYDIHKNLRNYKNTLETTLITIRFHYDHYLYIRDLL